MLLGFGHPLLMVFYLLFSFMSFFYGYIESKKEEPDSNEEIEIVFINISQWRAPKNIPFKFQFSGMEPTKDYYVLGGSAEQVDQ